MTMNDCCQLQECTNMAASVGGECAIGQGVDGFDEYPSTGPGAAAGQGGVSVHLWENKTDW